MKSASRAQLADDLGFTPQEQAAYGVKAGPLRSIVTQFRNICRSSATITWPYGLGFDAGQALMLHATVRNVFNHRPPDNILGMSVIEVAYTDARGRMLALGVDCAWR